MANRLMTAAQAEAHNARVRGQTKSAAPAEVLNGKDTSADTAASPAAADPNAEWLANQLEAQGQRVKRQFCWARGRKYRCDVAVPEVRLIVEVNGAPHRIKKRFHDDILKAQEAILQGWTLMPVSTKQVRSGEACRLVQQAIATLKAGSLPF